MDSDLCEAIIIARRSEWRSKHWNNIRNKLEAIQHEEPPPTLEGVTKLKAMNGPTGLSLKELNAFLRAVRRELGLLKSG